MNSHIQTVLIHIFFLYQISGQSRHSIHIGSWQRTIVYCNLLLGMSWLPLVLNAFPHYFQTYIVLNLFYLLA